MDCREYFCTTVIAAGSQTKLGRGKEQNDWAREGESDAGNKACLNQTIQRGKIHDTVKNRHMNLLE